MLSLTKAIRRKRPRIMKEKNANSIISASALKTLTSAVRERKGVKRKTHTRISVIVPTFLKKGPTACIRLVSTIKRRKTSIIPMKPARWTPIFGWSRNRREVMHTARMEKVKKMQKHLKEELISSISS